MVQETRNPIRKSQTDVNFLDMRPSAETVTWLCHLVFTLAQERQQDALCLEKYQAERGCSHPDRDKVAPRKKSEVK